MTPYIDPVDPELRKMMGQAANLGDPINEIKKAVVEMLPDAVAVFAVVLTKKGPRTAAFAPGRNHSMMLVGEASTLLQAFTQNTIDAAYGDQMQARADLEKRAADAPKGGDE